MHPPDCNRNPFYIQLDSMEGFDDNQDSAGAMAFSGNLVSGVGLTRLALHPARSLSV